MNRAIPATALLVLLALSPAAPAQDPAKRGTPAFVPAESAAVAAQLRAAAATVTGGQADVAVESYQAVVDGPLAGKLAANDRDRDTLENAGERAQREMAADPALRAAHRKRYGEIARQLLDAALARGDSRGLRDAHARFPLTDAGAAAGLMLARAAWRAGDADECLGILDRLLDLHADALPPSVRAADVLALRAAAAAATGDGDLLEETARAAALLGDAALAARVTAARAALAPPGPPGPRGPLVLLWKWRPADEDMAEPEDGSRNPLLPSGFPPPPNHLLAVSGGRVYWTDRFRVTALDLATGLPVARSVAAGEGLRPASPTDDHEGETFAPAADARGIVAPLDLPDGDSLGNRAGSLGLFDRDLRLVARRGGDADIEHPDWSARFVFHGRPLLAGDRVYCAATETAGREGRAVGDVRTHVIAFRRDGLEPLWDSFVSYGIGLRRSDVAPAGSVVQSHGRLYLSTQTGLEACLDARTGAILWVHRYRTPESAQTPRLGNSPDKTLAVSLWYESPPVFSGNFVAFAPRESFDLELLHRRPDGRQGYLRKDRWPRPRRDTEAMTAGWILPGPRGTFFLAGQTEHLEAAALLQMDPDSPTGSSIVWRADLPETQVVGLPVRAADALYAATDKAIYRVPFPSPDGVERIAVLPPRNPEDPTPSPGNLLVLPDRILSVHDDGVMCFGPPPPTTPR